MPHELEWAVIEVLAALLVVAFTAWAGVVWHGLRRLDVKLDALLGELHKDRLVLERRVSTLEVIVERFEELLRLLRHKRPIVEKREKED